MTHSLHWRQVRIDQKLDEIVREFGGALDALLDELNQTRLNGTGTITAAPAIEKGNLRWTLAWSRDARLVFELTIIIQIEDNGQAAHVSRVWVRYQAATSLSFKGHTPTTRMRQLSQLSIAGIRQAISAEWPPEPALVDLRIEQRLQRAASDIVRETGPRIYRALAELNTARLDGHGRLDSAEFGHQSVRWGLEWQVEAIRYRISVDVILKDDGHTAHVDRVLVQRQASTPDASQGPPISVKRTTVLNVEEIQRRVVELWP